MMNFSNISSENSNFFILYIYINLKWSNITFYPPQQHFLEAFPQALCNHYWSVLAASVGFGSALLAIWSELAAATFSLEAASFVSAAAAISGCLTLEAITSPTFCSSFACAFRSGDASSFFSFCVLGDLSLEDRLSSSLAAASSGLPDF